MAPLEKLPSGNRYLLAETFRKWYGSTIFVSMEYAPLDNMPNFNWVCEKPVTAVIFHPIWMKFWIQLTKIYLSWTMNPDFLVSLSVEWYQRKSLCKLEKSMSENSTISACIMKPVRSKQIIVEILKGILSTFQTFFVSLKNIENCIYSEFSSVVSEIQKLQNFAPLQGRAKKSGGHVWHFFRPKLTPNPHWTQKMVFKNFFF